MIKTTLALTALSCLSLTAQTATSDNDKKSSGTIELFDGKTLEGWKKVNGTGKFKVEDGAIVGYGKNIKGNTFLRTEKEYDNFDITFEFKFDNLSGNSGFMFRAAQKPGENGRVFGYQCEADNKKRAWTAGLYDEARRGWLFPKKSQKFRAQWFTEQGLEITNMSDWNTIRIRCNGNHIQSWLNGVKRIDFVDTDPQHDTRKGFFALQVHGGKSCNVRWRNLRLTPIPPEK